MRARGLATHLLSRAELEALAQAPDLEALGDALRARGLLPAEAAATPDGLELAVRRVAAARLRVLARWASSRNALLSVIFADEDRHSLRALIRGSLQGAPPDERLAGLLPTPSLPERALGQLAAQPTPGRIATLLTAWSNPYGAALLPDATAAQPDLLALEYGLTRAFAQQALRGARLARSRELVAYVRETIDLENACAALVLAGAEREAPRQRAFVAGGRLLSLEDFLDAAAARDLRDAGRRLAAAFRNSAFAAVFAQSGALPVAVEEALLRQRSTAQRSAARRNPAGAAAVLEYVLRLRAEVLDLRRIIWGIALAAPAGEIAGGLVFA